jgi:hypothetical protein
MGCAAKTKKIYKKYDKSYAKTCLELSKNLIDNITTFLLLYTYMSFLVNSVETVSNNTTIINNSSINLDNQTLVVSDDNNVHAELTLAIMQMVCAFFGLVRIFNDFLNLWKFGNDVPEEAPVGDYIGIFGEDLGSICIEIIKGPDIVSVTPFALLSSSYKIFNFSYGAAKILLKIIIFGIKDTVSNPESDPKGALCIIKFLGFVILSGFYVLYCWITQFTNPGSDFSSSMFILFILYSLISLFHTYILGTMIGDYREYDGNFLREIWN